MSLDSAINLTKILLALALIQQSSEHLFSFKTERLIFITRLGLSLALLTCPLSKWVCLLLFINTIFMLKAFQGAYNGGSDRMNILVLSCLTLAYWLPAWQKIALVA